MPLTNSPRSSPPRGARRGTLLIAAVSGRALATAAVEAGYDALVCDFFADTDTHALTFACRKLPGDMAHGMQWRSLRPVLEALAKQAPSPLLGVIYGSGFEDRPQLLARIAARWPLLGNDATTVEAIKAPETFFGTLERLGIAHPDTRTERPPKGAGWVAKRRGAAGGSHVVPSRLQKDASDIYFQRLIEGRAISALFLANGRQCRIIGFSEQWTAPAPRRRWRYGGAVRPATLPKGAETEMASAVGLVAKAFGLTGLGSADFVLEKNQAYFLEINPRPGATLDIFAGAANPLLGLHMDAVTRGRLPRESLTFEGAAASAILHAPKGVIVPRNMIWPSWAADLPKPGEQIDKQRPMCTLLARAGTKGRAKRLVETRKASLLAKLENSHGEQCGQEEDRRKCSGTDEEAEREHPSRTAGARHHR